MKAYCRITDIETGQVRIGVDTAWNDGDEIIWSDGTNHSDANRSILFQLFDGVEAHRVVHMKVDPPRRFLVKIVSEQGRVIWEDGGL